METVTIFTAGDSQGDPGPAAIGISVVGESGKVLLEVSETIGNATNDYTDYFAVVRGLQACLEKFDEKTKDMQFELKLDSKLVKRQLNNECQIKNPGLVPFFIEIHNLRVASFPNLKLTQVSQAQNKKADRLVHEAWAVK